MATSRVTLSFLLVASSFLVTAAYNNSAAVDDDGVIGVSGLHLHFYMHDDYGSAHHGDIVVFNNLLTEGPERDSPCVGTAQGHGVRVAERGTVTDLSMHLVMDDGSGSVDVKGRIDTEAKVRESTVVGGAGRFRLARGYMLTSNYGYYDLANTTADLYFCAGSEPPTLLDSEPALPCRQ